MDEIRCLIRGGAESMHSSLPSSVTAIPSGSYSALRVYDLRCGVQGLGFRV
jgi:hypothetical protein